MLKTLPQSQNAHRRSVIINKIMLIVFSLSAADRLPHDNVAIIAPNDQSQPAMRIRLSRSSVLCVSDGERLLSNDQTIILFPVFRFDTLCLCLSSSLPVQCPSVRVSMLLLHVYAPQSLIGQLNTFAHPNTRMYAAYMYRMSMYVSALISFSSLLPSASHSNKFSVIR